MKSDSAIPGIICLVILAMCVGMLTCCANMPLTLSVHADQGRVSYSAKGGLEIIVEK